MTQDDIEIQAEFEGLLQKYQDIVSDLNVGWDPDAPIETRHATPAPLAFLRRLDAHMQRPDPAPQRPRKPILSVDFDGVLHGYQSGWKGASNIPDPPVPGALEWLCSEGMTNFEIHIFSARSAEDVGREAMKAWLTKNIDFMLRQRGVDKAYPKAVQLVSGMHFPDCKPPAFLSIDDRAITFTGTFPSAQQLLQFQTWQQFLSSDRAQQVKANG